MAMEENGAGATVCVTGASGYVGSWLVMRLLERGYRVKATVRDPGNVDKVKHILDLPNASTHLTLWKADLTEEASFDDAVQGCVGVFLVAAPLDFSSVKDPENEFIKPSIDGVLNVMRSCCKANTVRRIVYTSTAGTIEVQKQPLDVYDESVWSDVDFCRDRKMFPWMYIVAKTEAERAAWEFAKENNLDLVTIQPSTILGPYITPSKPSNSGMALALIAKNKYFYSLIKQGHAVHVDDLCNAHIYLFEHSNAEGRYICSSHDFTIYDIARSLSKKYPEYNIPTEFEGIEKSLKLISFPSKKLTGIGFKFKFNSEEYEAGDLFAESIEALKAKGELSR